MYSTVIKNKDTVWGWVRVHHLEQTFWPFNKLVTVVSTHFDITVDNSTHFKCRKHGISDNHKRWKPCMIPMAYWVPLTKQHLLHACRPHTAQPLVRYVVRIFTATSLAATTYSGGYCPTSIGITTGWQNPWPRQVGFWWVWVRVMVWWPRQNPHP